MTQIGPEREREGNIEHPIEDQSKINWEHTNWICRCLLGLALGTVEVKYPRKIHDETFQLSYDSYFTSCKVKLL